MHVRFLIALKVVTGRYTESLFAGYGNATVTAINEFGCRRGYYEPITFVGQDFNLDEQAKVVCAYSALIGSKYRAPSGTVSSLAWEWGIYKTDTVRNMYYKFKYVRPYSASGADPFKIRSWKCLQITKPWYA